MKTNKYSAHDQAIEKLRTAINNEHKSEITFLQISSFLGKDVSIKNIETLTYEVEIYSFEAIQPEDIIEHNSSILNF
ncbi:hypothetical protein [Pseudoalteromonas sp. TAB23]|uniref:hypothetical protein n=1 Tax=Pseudoalteromonas sp. TAB23 TaxID=1938595 RepID=UPI000421FD51|nr:hypothetical protein [Pseudoalteromonas sp. TAB23]